MSPLTARSVLRRFLVLTALRWGPTGLLIPVLMLLPLDRGLSVAEIGLAFAFQGFVVLALELPTGGLADTIGRRRVLLVSTAVSLVSIGIFALADTFALLAAAAALQGVYRALDSGPLEAWYVDTLHAADPEARIAAGMGGHGTIIGLSISGGAVVSGALVALEPVPGLEPLLLPALLAMALQVVGAVAIALLMVERRPVAAVRLWASVRRTPGTIAAGIGLLRGSRVLLALVCVELFWGFGSATYESLFPVRLAEVGGGTEAAAAIMGPASAVGWLAFSAGAAATTWLGRRWGVASAAMLMRVLQGLFVAAMGLLAGVVGVVAAYLACYMTHGGSNPSHMILLHRQVTGDVRATVVSLNSLMSQGAGAIGLIVLTALADSGSVPLAMYVGAVVLALAAPLYLPARRQERHVESRVVAI